MLTVESQSTAQAVSSTPIVVPAVKLPPRLQHLYGKVKGEKASTDKVVSVDTPMADAQRDYNPADVIRYIETSGGLDWNLFGYVTVIEKNDGSRVMINGQHRTGLVKTIAPNEKEVPAHIIKTDDPQYAARLFGLMNGVASRNVNGEQLLWAQVLAEDTGALNTKRVLEQCGLACGKVNDAPGRIQVKRSNFEKCIKMGEDATIRAVELCKKAFPDGKFDNLLSGLVRLLTITDYKSFGNSQIEIGKRFETWFTTILPMGGYKKATYPDMRINTWYNAIAYGLYTDFHSYMKYNKWQCPTGKSIKAVYKNALINKMIDEDADE